MDQLVALLRGVNVGKSNRIQNAELVEICETLALQNPRTLLASGNIIFHADVSARSISKQLCTALAARGYDVKVLVLKGDDLRRRLLKCPFSTHQGDQVYGYFCDAPPMTDQGLLTQLRDQNEDVIGQNRTIWLHTPNGFSQSKVAQSFDKIVTGTSMTARNLNTITKLVEMLDS